MPHEPPPTPRERPGVRPRPSLAPAAATTRRRFLRDLGLAGAAGLLAACGRGALGSGASGKGTATASGPPRQSVNEVRDKILRDLGVQPPADLDLVLPQSEFLTGVSKTHVFGLRSNQGQFLKGLDVTLNVVRDRDQQRILGPVRAQPFDEDFGQLGVWGVPLTFPEPGAYWVAATTPGPHAAVGALQATAPGSSPVPQVRLPFPVAPTPTTANPQGLAAVCTRRPACSMHDISLDQARAAGRPVVLTVATPAFCQTAICAPVVDIVQRVKETSGRRDVAWIHVEVYRDAGNTPLDFITSTLKLPSEPWTFFVARDGTLADKLEGPTPARLVGEALAKI